MTEIPPDVEQQLASMDEGSWSALVAKVRAPDTTEKLRETAAQVLSGTTLDAWLDGVDASKFADANGDIDEEKVMGKLTALFGQPEQTQQRRSWGQHGGQPPGKMPGDAGRAEAAKRFGGQQTNDQQQFNRGPGAGGRAEARKRFGGKQ